MTLHPPPPRVYAQISVLRPKSQPVGQNPSLLTQIPTSRPKSKPIGPNPSLKTQIPACWPKSEPVGLYHSLEALIPAMRLKAQISVSRLRFLHLGPNLNIMVQISPKPILRSPKSVSPLEISKTDRHNGSPLCSTGHRPFGAAALLSPHYLKTTAQQGNGYR